MAYLLGHQWAKDAIARAHASGRASHAYLITGPAQVGKLTTALALAQVLLCAEGSGCGTCRHCRLAERRVHPDLRVLEKPTERKSIPIKDVHEFTQGIALRPLEAERRVLIIEGADQLSADGADALLKNLEEPPPGVTFLLTALDPTGMPPTVGSRCQRIALYRVPQHEIADFLCERFDLAREQADSLAKASAGRPGWAILAAQDPELVAQRRQWAADLLQLLSADLLERIRYADRLAERWTKDSEAVRAPLQEWLGVWEDLAQCQWGTSHYHSLVAAVEIRRVASTVAGPAAPEMLASTLKTLDALEANANPRLALEALLLRLPTAGQVRDASGKSVLLSGAKPPSPGPGPDPSPTSSE